ncbi:hypothetical protein FPZ24_06230 [Sphingomonas panacisoli]|uniref:Uncharacterized protein n=1 Tax=Sphingomonas panacisoli TaxID=1813879 RepID=A0A5B8LJ35_9SPHN|nr:hypothetical protein [Sphingomonas panacisoli]QDZ07130.1 hypothetical protein FPZ24_06230 [Sphingomonas panacisoli]
MSDRYDGKPFLRLLDSYILDAIGHLDTEMQATLTRLEPKFHKAFNTPGDWRTIVATVMKFPDGMPGAIREVWEKGKVRFAEMNGQEPDPAEFTQIFVDTNFPNN